MDKNLNASSPLLDRNQSQKSFKKYLNPSPTTTIIPTPTNSSINSSIDSSQHSDWRSLYICTFLTFCSAVQFSLYFSSMRQYLQIMDSSASENFYGYIVASYSLGQMIASPIVGYLSNRLKKIRHLLYIGIFLAFLGNALYLCVHLFPIEERRYALLIGRFVTGIGSSNISLLKAYASSASTQRDRSRAIALVTGGVALGMTMGPGNISLLKAYASSASTQRDRSRAIALVTGGVALGMTMGPAFQLLFTPIGYPGPNILISGLMLSMYTAPALMACIMNAVNAFCIFAYFREVYAGVISSRSQINRNEPALPKIDKRALFLCYFTRFTQMFINTNLETLGASLAMVLFAWTRTESVKYFSAAQAIMSLLAFLIYVGFIMFRFDRFLHERCNVIASLFALLLFHVLTYSYPFLPGHLTTYSSEDYPFNGTDIDDDISNEEIQHVGCDTSKFSWCNSVRSINPFYFYICYILFIGLAFPSLNVSLNTLFSKIIGPRRQGFQQGLLQMAGGAARMVGPVVIRFILD
uniref:Major facilitator superfamily (MFS) profile domain-containing protein n=1 Tax=Meloidogyne incognita TaxID=6306 RepID=A0A914NF51_MELIC